MELEGILDDNEHEISLGIELSLDQAKKDMQNLNISDITTDGRVIFEVELYLSIIIILILILILTQEEKTKTLKEDYTRTIKNTEVNRTEEEIYSEFSELEVIYKIILIMNNHLF